VSSKVYDVDQLHVYTYSTARLFKKNWHDLGYSMCPQKIRYLIFNRQQITKLP